MSDQKQALEHRGHNGSSRLARVRHFAASARRLLSARTRRAWVGDRHAEVEYRRVGPEQLRAIACWFETNAANLPDLDWVDVNPHTRRVTFRFASGAFSREELVDLVERAEADCDCTDAVLHDAAHDHPADDEPRRRHQVGAVAELAGMGLGSILRLAPFGPAKVGTRSAMVLALVRTLPQLRSRLDERLGPERAEFSLDLAGAVAQSLAQRPLTLLVLLLNRIESLREADARRQIWDERCNELNRIPANVPVEDGSWEPRPQNLPQGPIEDYAERAWFLSLTGFGLSLAATRSVRRAVAALFGAIPQPARLGREVFAVELGRSLAKRRSLLMNTSALRKLDRVDCLVLQGDLARHRPVGIASVHSAAGEDAAAGERAAKLLFDRQGPLTVQKSGHWTLGPVSSLDVEFDEELTRVHGDLDARGVLALGLSQGGRGVGIVEIRIRAEIGAQDVVAAARAAGMKVVVAGADAASLEELGCDDFIGPQEGVRAGVRRLQAEGQVVFLVATAGSTGLGVADVALGLCRDGEPTPWGADILCGADLSEARMLVEACVVARRVSKQSVNAGLAAATLGTLVSAGGAVDVSSRRVFFVLNLASLTAMANGFRSAVGLERRRLSAPRDPTPWHALTPEGVIARLRTRDTGLSWIEARERTAPSSLGRPAALRLLDTISDEFFNPLGPLLAAGAGLSAVVGSTADAAFIGGVFGLSAVIGGVQRFRAETAIDDLAQDTRRTILVRRSGRVMRIGGHELVRGDIVLLRAGDVVPADCRLLDTDFLEIDASSLTGESLPIRKYVAPAYDAAMADRASMLYESTTVAAGRGVAVVVATGEDTEARRGAGGKPERAVGGVELRLRQLMSLTGPVALGAGTGVVLAGLIRGRKMSDLVSSAVSLAVGSVPEGLPLLASAAQLAAAQRLSVKGALVRRARSVEALGRVDVLCFDKTGTVTEGRMGVHSVSDGATEERLVAASGARLKTLGVAVRATPLRRHDGSVSDPTDEAVRIAAKACGLDRTRGFSDWQRVDELPFEPGRGYHAVVGRVAQGYALSVKGAPEALLSACTATLRAGKEKPLDERGRETLFSEAAALARRGLRVLAVAERVTSDVPDTSALEKLVFHGFLALSDPVRPTAAAALAEIRRAGVDVVMITGDHPSTASAVAAELDLMRGRQVMTGAELSRLDDAQLAERLPQVAAFARVTPAQKVRVVRTLQRMNRVPAMAGDGANDAPAMRLADVGIAVGAQATAAARSAADVIVVDGRMETIVEALIEGRAMWASVREAVSILVGGNFGEIAFSLGGGLVDGRPPLTARQLLLVNLLTDVAPAMAIAVRPPAESERTRLQEEGPDASLSQPLNKAIATRALATAIGASAGWGLGRLTGTVARARTIGLVSLVGSQLAQTLTMADHDRSVMLTGLGSAAILAAIVQTPFVSRAFGCRPLGPLGWTIALGGSALGAYAGNVLPKYVDAYDPQVREQIARLRNTRVARVLAREMPLLPEIDPGALYEE